MKTKFPIPLASSHSKTTVKRIGENFAALRHLVVHKQFFLLEGKGRGRTIGNTLKNISIFKFSFVIFVIIPAIYTVIYFAFLASDQFSTEMRFAVRTPQLESGREREADGGVKTGTNVAATNNPVRALSLVGQEAYVVAAYITSNAIFEDLPKSLDLRAIFTRPEADYLARLKSQAAQEDLLRYWRSMVDVNVNNMSGVVTVWVKAFTPQDSFDIAHAIIQASEVLVNRLSERARNDAVGRAEQEVRRNEKLVRSALEDLRIYRDKERFIDPSSEASSAAALLTRAMGERIRLQNEYFVATRAMSATAPSVLVLKAGLDAIDQQIEQLKGRMTGAADKRTISATIGQYEELELRRQFAEKLYIMAQDALERARQKAERQNVYLSVFVPPALPQLALFPERISMSLLICGMFLVIWGILALITAAVRDHVV